jgi:hypothetical protein
VLFGSSTEPAPCARASEAGKGTAAPPAQRDSNIFGCLDIAIYAILDQPNHTRRMVRRVNKNAEGRARNAALG